MSDSGIGVMIKRFFVRARPAPEESDAPLPTRGASTHAAPSLILLVPEVAGVSAYNLHRFTDAHEAADFLEASGPNAFFLEGVVAFWALHSEPISPHEAECAALVRVESDLVRVFAFVDLETALSYVRFHVEENGDVLQDFEVYWAAPAVIAANPSGEVRIEPSSPPAPAHATATREMRHDTVPSSPDVPEPPGVEPRAPEPEANQEAADIPPDPRPVARVDIVPSSPDVPESSPAEPTRPEPVVEPGTVETPADPQPAVTDILRSSDRPVGPRLDPLIADTPALAVDPLPPVKTPRRHSSSRVRAKALELGAAGHSAREVERELKVTFSATSVPAYSTISRWLRDAGVGRTANRKLDAMRAKARALLEERFEEISELPLSEIARVVAAMEDLDRAR